MNADQVSAIVAKQYPAAMQSPLARAFAGIAAKDQADCVIAAASLTASIAVDTLKNMRAEALTHAKECISACDAQGVEYDEETLSANIESNFPELSMDDWDDIARVALG